MKNYSAQDNTVSSSNQMINSNELYYLGSQNAKLKILILGNSITRHGPKKDIFWENDWGMAASCMEKDYVHVLFDKLKSKNLDVCFMVRQSATWERTYPDCNLEEMFSSERQFKADIVLFNLGENITTVQSENDETLLYNKMKELFDFVGDNVIIANCVWKNKFVDECLKNFSLDNNKQFINLNYLGENPDKYLAIGKFKHEGVSMHPDDEGMKAIANEFFDKILFNQGL